MIQSVRFGSRVRALELAPAADIAILSITDPGQEPARLNPEHLNVLRVSFHDTVHRSMVGIQSFNRRMAREIIDWLNKLNDIDGDIRLFVHCEAGASRSPAVALFVNAYFGVTCERMETATEANPLVLNTLCREAKCGIPKIPSTPVDNENDKGLKPWF